MIHHQRIALRLVPASLRRTAHHAQRYLVEPELLAEIEYRAKSPEGKVRHPLFKGIREDDRECQIFCVRGFCEG
jgi:ATP-dependent DNA ligase